MKIGFSSIISAVLMLAGSFTCYSQYPSVTLTPSVVKVGDTITVTISPGGWELISGPTVSGPVTGSLTPSGGALTSTDSGYVTVSTSWQKYNPNIGTEEFIDAAGTATVLSLNLSFSPDSICAKSDWTELQKEDYTYKIELVTNPDGYEKDVVLSVKKTNPSNQDKGTLKKIDDDTWEYTALTESKSDKWPGEDDMGKRYWNVTFTYDLLGIVTGEEEQKVYSVFKFFSDVKNNKEKAKRYVVWKYNNVLAGKKIGEYSWVGPVGVYGWTTPLCSVFYGASAFDSENILASVIIHEDVHGRLQSVWRRVLGAQDRRNYYWFLVYTGVVPKPPIIPSEYPIYGLEWARMELPAYNAEVDNREATGAAHDSNGGYFEDEVLPWRNFFQYFIH